MSLWTLVDGWAGEFIAHWTLQVRLHLLVVMVAKVVQTNLTPFILWQTVKTLLGRLLSSTPDLTFTVSGQE